MIPSCAGFTGFDCACIAASSRVRGLDVDDVAADQARQRRARQPGRLEHQALLGGGGETAELRDELAHGAVALAVGVMNRIGGDQPGEALRRIPVRRGRIRWLPLASSRASSPSSW